MSQALSRAARVAALAALMLVASCATPEPEPAPAPEPPPAPTVEAVPPLALNSGVAQSASVYVAYIRELQQIQAPFGSADAVQQAIRVGAAYESVQLSRSMISYGAVLALQSPQFVQGLRSYATTPGARQQILNRLLADPYYAASLPGADAAAGIIVSTLGRDAAMIAALAERVEEDAYTIQGRSDPRRRWASTPIADRQNRLDGAKTLSAQRRMPAEPESEQLFNAAHASGGWGAATSGYARPPYTPAVARSLAIAAMAALGAAGEDSRTYTDALAVESNSEFCLNMSKLMLFQCLAASRPSYEDIFCIGRHIVRDMAVCTSQAAGSGAVATPAPMAVEATPVPAPAAPAPTTETGPRPYQ